MKWTLTEDERKTARTAFDRAGGIRGFDQVKQVLRELGQPLSTAQSVCLEAGYDGRTYLSLIQFYALLEVLKRHHFTNNYDPRAETEEAFVAVLDHHRPQDDEDDMEDEEPQWVSPFDNSTEGDSTVGADETISQATLARLCKDFQLTIDLEEVLGERRKRISREEFGQLLSDLEEGSMFAAKQRRLRRAQSFYLTELADLESNDSFSPTFSFYSTESEESPKEDKTEITATTKKKKNRGRRATIVLPTATNLHRTTPLLNNNWPQRRPSDEVEVVLTNKTKPPPSSSSLFKPLFTASSTGRSSAYGQAANAPKKYAVRGKSTLEWFMYGRQKGQPPPDEIIHDLSPRTRALLLDDALDTPAQAAAKQKQRMREAKKGQRAASRHKQKHDNSGDAITSNVHYDQQQQQQQQHHTHNNNTRSDHVNNESNAQQGFSQQQRGASGKGIDGSSNSKHQENSTSKVNSNTKSQHRKHNAVQHTSQQSTQRTAATPTLQRPTSSATLPKRGRTGWDCSTRVDSPYGSTSISPTIERPSSCFARLPPPSKIPLGGSSGNRRVYSNADNSEFPNTTISGHTDYVQGFVKGVNKKRNTNKLIIIKNENNQLQLATQRVPGGRMHRIISRTATGCQDGVLSDEANAMHHELLQLKELELEQQSQSSMFLMMTKPNTSNSYSTRYRQQQFNNGPVPTNSQGNISEITSPSRPGRLPAGTAETSESDTGSPWQVEEDNETGE